MPNPYDDDNDDDDDDDDGHDHPETAVQPDDQVDEEEQRVTAHSYGALDVTGVGHECWMIRLPPKLAQVWEHAPEGTPLGQLIFTKGGGANTTTSGASGKPIKPQLMVHVSEQLAHEFRDHQLQKQQQKLAAAVESTKPTLHASSSSAATSSSSSIIPLKYSLAAMTKKIPTMHPFVRNPRNGSVQLLGTVSRTANLQVEQDSHYRALLKDRLVATTVTSSRYVKPVEATESVIHKTTAVAAAVDPSSMLSSSSAAASSSSAKKSFGNAVLQFGKRMLEAAQDSKNNNMHSSHNNSHHHAAGNGTGSSAAKKARQFSPDQPIRSVLFELFGQAPYWTVKDLKAAAVAGGATHAGTKRAEAEMRDVLREIGDYHRSGDHKNMWELRKEFQQAK